MRLKLKEQVRIKRLKRTWLIYKPGLLVIVGLFVELVVFVSDVVVQSEIEVVHKVLRNRQISTILNEIQVNSYFQIRFVCCVSFIYREYFGCHLFADLLHYLVGQQHWTLRELFQNTQGSEIFEGLVQLPNVFVCFCTSTQRFRVVRINQQGRCAIVNYAFVLFLLIHKLIYSFCSLNF